MGLPAEKIRRATCADVEVVPANEVAELLRGALHVMPRPAPKHARGEPAAIHHGAAVPQAPPFAAVGLDPTALWA